jgi:two-component system response regulator FixJ
MVKHNDPTVVVVEDDIAICKSLSWLFGSVNLKTKIYSDPATYLEAYNPNEYSCLLVDIRLPGMSGLQLLKLLVQRRSPIPAIILTGHGDTELAIRAMKLGVKDFILKPYNDDLLLEKIQTVLAESYEQQTLYQQFFDKLNNLTKREKEVLQLIVKGKLNKLIANELRIALSTVELHRANIMHKLQAKSIAELVKICFVLTNSTLTPAI